MKKNIHTRGNGYKKERKSDRRGNEENEDKHKTKNTRKQA